MQSPDGGLPPGDLDDASQPQSRKRKATSTGSRGVATLSTEQLAKKRANDREAQRAIRERTKRQIQELQDKIRELESRQPYQELQAVVRQKDAVEAENIEIKKRLASVMGLIQPILANQGLTDLASAAQSSLPTSSNAFAHDPYLNGQGRPYSSGQNISQTDPSYSPYAQEPAPDNRVWSQSRDALDHQRDNLNRGLELNDSGERLSFHMLLDSLAQRPSQHTHSSPHRQTSYPSLSGASQHYAPTSPATLPKHVDPTCPLDSILLNFYHARRADTQISPPHSHSPTTPVYPSVSSLLNPSASHKTDPVSQLMTDIISKFPNISALPDQVATLFSMFTLARWLIHPTQLNYDRIPDFLIPRPSQLMIPHPAWIDHVPFPRMRDKLIHNFKDLPFEQFFLPFTVGLCVNWPYDPTDCLISRAEGEEPMINPVFERHIRRLENWSVAPVFMDTFPSLTDTARVRAQPQTGAVDGGGRGE